MKKSDVNGLLALVFSILFVGCWLLLLNQHHQCRPSCSLFLIIDSNPILSVASTGFLLLTLMFISRKGEEKV